MPRVTFVHHLHRYTFLRLLWREVPAIYAVLPAKSQWELHAVYQPGRQLGSDELELHLAGIKRAQPSLLNRTGKHFRRIEDIHFALRERGFSLSDKVAFRKALTAYLPRTRPARAGKREIVLAPIARPEPNVEQLARALLAIAKDRSDQRDRP